MTIKTSLGQLSPEQQLYLANEVRLQTEALGARLGVTTIDAYLGSMVVHVEHLLEIGLDSDQIAGMFRETAKTMEAERNAQRSEAEKRESEEQ